MSKKKPSVPRKKIKIKDKLEKFKVPKPLPAVQFNAGKLIFQYIVVVRLKEQYMKEEHPLYFRFEGMQIAYDDWFEEMGITQDNFDMVSSHLDPGEIVDEVERLYPVFMEQWDKMWGKTFNKRLIIPAEDPMSAKAAMDVFRDTLRKGGGKK